MGPFLGQFAPEVSWRVESRFVVRLAQTSQIVGQIVARLPRLDPAMDGRQGFFEAQRASTYLPR